MRTSLSSVPLGLLVVLLGCVPKPHVPVAASSGAGPAAGRTVNLAIWSNYLAAETLPEFEKKTGIHVQVSNYSSNEELLAKLQAGASGYDVVVPSDYMVFAMGKLGLVKELELSKLSHFNSLNPRFLRRGYDPTNKVSVPFNWGTTGIAVNRSLYKGKIRGWKDLFENKDLAGKLSMLDDVRETIGAALKYKGFSLNSKDPAQIQAAKAALLSLRPRIKSFTSEPMMPLVNAETAVAHAYMSDALQARRKTGGKIEYVIPEEGGTLWVDNLVIPVGAPHVEEAMALIDFLIEAHAAASTVEHVLVAPVNSETLALLPAALRTDPMLFPSDKLLSRCEMIQDLGESLAVWDRVWTEIKAQSE